MKFVEVAEGDEEAVEEALRLIVVVSFGDDLRNASGFYERAHARGSLVGGDVCLCPCGEGGKFFGRGAQFSRGHRAESARESGAFHAVGRGVLFATARFADDFPGHKARWPESVLE